MTTLSHTCQEQTARVNNQTTQKNPHPHLPLVQQNWGKHVVF